MNLTIEMHVSRLDQILKFDSNLLNYLYSTQLNLKISVSNSVADEWKMSENFSQRDEFSGSGGKCGVI